MEEQADRTDFKQCPSCDAAWRERSDFLEDPSLELIGYQVSFQELKEGTFFFNHTHPSCGTTLGIPAGAFTDLYDGPIFADRMAGTEECREHCLHDDDLDRCTAKCECAYVREILQILKAWPRRA